MELIIIALIAVEVVIVRAVVLAAESVLTALLVSHPGRARALGYGHEGRQVG